jgi:hypothetical protein
MESLDDIFEMPSKKLVPQKEDPEVKKYIDDLTKDNYKSVVDTETETDINTPKSIEKKQRKKHNIPPEKLEIMKANLKKGRDAIKAKKEARLRGEIKEQIIKEMKDNQPKKEIVKEEPKVVKEEPKEHKVNIVKKIEPSLPPPVVKPYVIKSLFKTPIW